MIAKNILDYQYQLFNEHISLAANCTFIDTGKYGKLLATTLHKNLFSFNAAIGLTEEGMFGSARLIFRNIYEYLVLSKYVCLKDDIKLYRKWENGDNISLKRAIFSNIKDPRSKALNLFWQSLCQLTHSTIYSQQVNIEYDDDNKVNIELNLVYLRILLDMNYHLMNTYYFTSSMKYHLDRIDREESIFEVGMLKLTKGELKELLIKSRAELKEEPRKIIYDYKRKWQFKEETCESK